MKAMRWVCASSYTCAKIDIIPQITILLYISRPFYIHCVLHTALMRSCKDFEWVICTYILCTYIIKSKLNYDQKIKKMWNSLECFWFLQKFSSYVVNKIMDYWSSYKIKTYFKTYIIQKWLFCTWLWWGQKQIVISILLIEDFKGLISKNYSDNNYSKYNANREINKQNETNFVWTINFVAFLKL
jgi:hypothetical protein